MTIYRELRFMRWFPKKIYWTETYYDWEWAYWILDFNQSGKSL